jgi:hypothetical protein
MRSLEHVVRDLMTGKNDQRGQNQSLNTSIIKLMTEQRIDVETDENDQISVGTYRTRHFEVSPEAQKLYVDLPRDININEMEKAAIILDELFALVEKVDSKERAEPMDVSDANNYIKRIKYHAAQAKMDSQFGFLESVLGRITKHLDTDTSNTFDADKFNLRAAMKRFMTPSYTKTTEHDKDIDNSRFALSRNLKAQRKLKIIDND